MILTVCFMKINELLSGLWGAGGGLTPLQLTARLSPDGLSAYQLTVSLAPFLCCTPTPSLLSACRPAPVEAPKTLFTQLDLAISYSCVSLSALL